MEQPTWHGIELDAATALALLEWQAEMGVDEPVLDAPVDRFDLAAAPPPHAGYEYAGLGSATERTVRSHTPKKRLKERTIAKE